MCQVVQEDFVHSDEVGQEEVERHEHEQTDVPKYRYIEGDKVYQRRVYSSQKSSKAIEKLVCLLAFDQIAANDVSVINLVYSVMFGHRRLEQNKCLNTSHESEQIVVIQSLDLYDLHRYLRHDKG